MINLIIDGLPQYVDAGRPIKINSDFRTGMLFEIMMQDATIGEGEKAGALLSLFFENEANDFSTFHVDEIQDLINGAIWFYSCGKETNLEESQEDEGCERDPLIYSFEHDAPYIYAAFRQAYAIDLTREEMHWWEFRALMNALPESTQIVKIMGYRATKITADMSKEQKKHLAKMKKIYELPDMRSQEEKDAAFGAMFG